MTELDTDLWILIHRDVRRVARIEALSDFLCPRLFGIAYRMLGLHADAEDILIAEDSGFVSIAKARQELGWDPDFRLGAQQITRSA
jgi:hypothetical protein